MKGRNYGETVCVCGTRFTRKSPTQLFHSKECRNRVMTVQAGTEEGAPEALSCDEKDSRGVFIPRL